MATLLSCPECDATLKLAAPPPEGKRVKCPKCEAVFVPEAVEDRRVSAERPVAPARPRSRPASDEDDRDDDRPRRPRKKKRGANGLLIGLLVGGGVLAMLLIVCAGVGALLFFRPSSPPQPKQVVQVNNPAPAAAPAPLPNANPNPNPNPNANPPAAGGNGAGQDGNKGADNGAQPPMVPPAMPGPGAGVMPGNQAQIMLSNAKASHLGLRLAITVDYRFTQGGPAIGQNIFVIIRAGRHNYEARILPFDVHNQGTWELSGISFGGPERGPFEISVETGFPGAFGPRQTISNTVTAN
jgi:hypothetical protein